MSTQFCSKASTPGSFANFWAASLFIERVSARIRYPDKVSLLLKELDRVSTTLRPELPVEPTIRLVGTMDEEEIEAPVAEVRNNDDDVIVRERYSSVRKTRAETRVIWPCLYSTPNGRTTGL